MAFYGVRTIGLSCLKIGSLGSAASKCVQSNLGIISQIRTTKHWNPKFKKLRGQKVIKVDLPDFEEFKKHPEDLPEEEVRSKLKERGIFPEAPWVERPIYFSCTGGIFEAYVPPEGDGKVSPISKAGAKQALQFLEKKSKSMLAIRKLRKFDDDFEVDDFLNEAKEIYAKAHEAMAEKSEENMVKYATEKAYAEMIYNSKNKTMRWKLISEVEQPRLVHARSTELISKENVFSQLTVRFFTQQTLAIYDRFGRLMHGSEIIAKDVLEYVVFEKHMANKYGKWRIHGKIIPNWMPPKDNSIKTCRMELPPPTEKLPAPASVASQEPSDSPQLATA